MTENQQEILDVATWNSVVDSVNENSKAIKKLSSLPEAFSELKAMITQLLPTDDDEGYIHEEEYGSEQSFDDLEETAKNLIAADKNSDSSIQEILDQTQREPEYGPNLRDDIAKSFGRLINKKISKDTLQKWKDEYKAPENCKTLGIPRVNHEIWAALPNKIRQSDVQFQTLQGYVSMTSVALSKIAEKIVSEGSLLPGKWQQDMLQSILECATINSLSNQTIITQRKKEIKPALSKEAAAICSANNITTELLFGENFQDEIKASKSALNVMKQKQMKPLQARGSFRYQPYNYGKYSGNFQRPPPTPFRGGPRLRFLGRRPVQPQRQVKSSVPVAQTMTTEN